MPKKIIFLLIIFITLIIYIVFESDDQVKIVFFDVGQGDSILIIINKNFQLLVDGGPDNAVAQKIGKYIPFYDHTIEMMVLTHPDTDHVTGLVELLDRYEIKHILHSGVRADNAAYGLWLEKIQQLGIKETIARSGQKYQLPDNCFLNVLHPSINYYNQAVANVNSTSVVTEVVINEIELLLTGDITSTEELMIINSFPELKSDILKVAHHGSKYSSADEFIERIDPDISVIQVGLDNKFGHPAERVLKLFAKLGILTLRTDLLGDILLKTDGKEIYQ